MKFIEEGATTEDVNKALDRLYRRIVQLENDDTIVLPTSAPRDPSVGQAFFDVSSGAPIFWDGSSWVSGVDGGGP